MNSLNQSIKWDGPHRSNVGVPGGTALVEWQSGMPALSLQEVYRKELQGWVLRVGCSARGGQLELRMASCHMGNAFPSKDPLWWPSQESRAGLVTEACVSQGPGVTRQVPPDMRQVQSQSSSWSQWVIWLLTSCITRCGYDYNIPWAKTSTEREVRPGGGFSWLFLRQLFSRLHSNTITDLALRSGRRTLGVEWVSTQDPDSL